jgi:hypothetical protein
LFCGSSIPALGEIMTDAFTESIVEEAALAWLESAGWQIAHGPEIAPDIPVTERRDAGDDALADTHLPKPQEARQ